MAKRVIHTCDYCGKEIQGPTVRDVAMISVLVSVDDGGPMSDRLVVEAHQACVTPERVRAIASLAETKLAELLEGARRA